jgi:hypothetical protein
VHDAIASQGQDQRPADRQRHSAQIA